MILIAGPYRSGTGDDPVLMNQNLSFLEKTGLEIWKKGHLPVIGEWLALPLMKQAGSRSAGDTVYQEFAYPVAERLIAQCDAVLRMQGPSKGADQDVALAKRRGLPIYFSLQEIPDIQ